jgi:hypothetical protein
VAGKKEEQLMTTQADRDAMQANWDAIRADMAREAAELRRISENPDRPLNAALVMTTASDPWCSWCRGQGKDEDDCLIDELIGGTWIVTGHAGGNYHLACARELGWTPSQKETAYLEQYPNGPYA